MPDILTLYIAFWVFIIGLCIGSFLNVVILRGLSGESIVFPPSKCPKCQHALKWWHNIPLLSYLILRGKCYFCHEKISPQYFAVELITGILFTAVFFKFGLTINMLLMLVIFSLFVVMTVTDLREKIIFDMHAFILAGAGLIFSLINHNLLNSVLGLLEGILIMEIFASIGYLFVKSRAFGIGDTYIAGALGVIFGWAPLLLVLILSLIVQAVITMPLYLFKLYKSKNFKTLISLVLFLLIAAVYKILSLKTDINIIILYIGILLVVISGLYCVRQVTRNIKSASEAIILPFGPAMFIAAAVFLFLN
ncbi:prepilin peptidase [bacterium]|nr:prepilin peptidase [bacterium]